MIPKSNNRYSVHILLLFLVASIIMFNACDDDFTVGEEYIESQTEMSVVDTLSVDLSTVLLDTLKSSGTGRMLVGHYRDESFGELSSCSYFQVGIPYNDYNIQVDDVYDSLNLVLFYDGYSFGDTTSTMKLSVHCLSENIDTDDEAFLKTETTFSYDPDPVGSILFTPQPKAEDTLSIKLSDVLGLDLFSRIQQESDQLSYNESFLDFFPGFVLVADEAYDGVVIGFVGSESNAQLVLHSSRHDESIEYISNNFLLYDEDKQFNHITRNFSATQLNALTEQKNALSSDETNGYSYMQGGTGLGLKVSFPSLPELLLREQGEIVEATLIIAPKQNSYNDFDLPSSLKVYELDKVNRVIDNQTYLAASTLKIDELYGEDTVYSFDLTSYILDDFSDSYVDPDKGLFLSLTFSDMRETFDRLIIDAENRHTMLKIFYLSY